jgi:hypothetical protein
MTGTAVTIPLLKHRVIATGFDRAQNRRNRILNMRLRAVIPGGHRVQPFPKVRLRRVEALYIQHYAHPSSLYLACSHRRCGREKMYRALSRRLFRIDSTFPESIESII